MWNDIEHSPGTPPIETIKCEAGKRRKSSVSTDSTTRSSKKAEKARENRRKKKEFVSILEDEVISLKEEIESIQRKEASDRAKMRLEDRKLRISMGKEDDLTAAIREEQKQVLLELKALVARNASDSTIRPYLETYSNNMKKCQLLFTVYMDKFMSCLQPGVQVKFMLWLLSRDDAFYAEESGLWTCLNKEMGIKTSQSDALLTLRPILTSRKDEIATLQSAVTQVSRVIELSLQHLHSTMDDLEDILTPTQFAKFCIWISENNWTMQMLNSLWSVSAPDPDN